jgi:GDSL-like Lipase/Acylhydrolase
MRVSITSSLLLLGMVGPACCAGESRKVTAIGVLGDSYSDEYQFYPPDRSTAQNWVEILARARGLSFGRYSTESRGEPRIQGFEFNWARSDATSTDMIKSGQHTGLAGQVASGEVGVVVIFIGGNDFIYALHSRDAAALVHSVLTRAQANLRIAVDTILRASPRVHLLIATLPNILELPEFAEPL